MVVRRINPLSCAKVFGVLYALGGLLAGAFISILAMLGGLAGLASDEPGGAFLGLIFGAGAIIVLPIFYGVMGAIVTTIAALLYNLVAGLTGGIEVEVS